MTAEVLPRFGEKQRHRVREQVYDSMVQGQLVVADDISDIKIQLGLMDLSNKQVARALNALSWKHHLIKVDRPRLGRSTRGWAVRKLND